jgi:hypothetical protein
MGRSLPEFDLVLTLTGNTLCTPGGAGCQPVDNHLAESIAHAARQLAGQGSVRIALRLPGAEFLAMQVQMPGVADERLLPAIELQRGELLPAVEQSLLLQAIRLDPLSGETLILWLSGERAESLFHEFELRGLFLALIEPRPLACRPEIVLGRNGLADVDPSAWSGWICDESNGSRICTRWQDGRVVDWISTLQADLELPPLAEQWRQAIGEWPVVMLDQPTHGGEAEGEVAGLQQQITLGEPGEIYFVPATAVQRIRERIGQRSRRRRIAVAAGLATLSMLLWAALSARSLYYEDRLERLKSAAHEASALRAEVVNLEERYAPIRDFPRIDVSDTLTRLNQMIPRESWIERFRIDNGMVEVEGYSPDPSGLVSALAGDERFIDVAFNRATRGGTGADRGDRFGIRFQLAGIDVAGYLEEHFPVER